MARLSFLTLVTIFYTWALPSYGRAAPSHQAKVISCLHSAKVPQALPDTADFTKGIIPYNLRLPFTPTALAIPSTVAQVQAAVSCAVKNDVTVSPRSGGHSYASHS